jgi:hypothetical protein
VDYTGDSTTSDVAVVVALLFSHLDGGEQAAGVPGFGDDIGFSQIVCRTRRHWAVRGIGCVWRFFWAKA